MAYGAPGVSVEETKLGTAPSTGRGRGPARPRRRLEARVVETSGTALSLAVRVEDPGTGAPPSPADAPRLSVEGSDAEPVPHRSGYALFLDLEDESVALLVDGGARYRDERYEFDVSNPPVVAERTLARADGPA